jgi:hypothetical protein
MKYIPWAMGYVSEHLVPEDGEQRVRAHTYARAARPKYYE